LNIVLLDFDDSWNIEDRVVSLWSVVTEPPEIQKVLERFSQP
jgi:hypothetical protein